MAQTHLLTTSEAAGLLGVSGRTVARWADSGRLSVAYKAPSRKGVRLFAEPDVMALRAQLLARFSPVEAS